MPNVATRFQPNINGTSIPSGFIGEVIDLTSNGSVTISNTGTYYNVMASSTPNVKLTLTPGYWHIFGSVCFGSGSVSTGTMQGLDAIISTSSSTPDITTTGLSRIPINTTSIPTSGYFLQVFRVVNISANTDYYLLTSIQNTSAATTTITVNANSRMFAFRLN